MIIAHVGTLAISGEFQDLHYDFSVQLGFGGHTFDFDLDPLHRSSETRNRFGGRLLMQARDGLNPVKDHSDPFRHVPTPSSRC